MVLISRDEAIVMLEDMEGRRDEDGYIRVYKTDVIANLRSLPSIDFIKCGECKHSKDWYGDHRLCYLWSETGVGVFEDGFCSYGKRRSDEHID